MYVEEAIDTASRAEPHLLGVAMLIYAISVLIAATRWLIASRHPLTLSSLIAFSEAVLVGTFFNNLISFYGISGELGRIAWASIKTRAPYARLTAGAIGERLTEALVALAYVLTISWAVGLKIPVFINVRDRAREALEVLRELSRRPADMAMLLATSLAIYVLDTARIAVVAMSFGIEVTLPLAMTLTIVGVLSRFAPIPAGAGVFEGGFVGVMVAFGYGARDGVMLAIGERIVSTIMPSAAGGLIVLRSGGIAAFRSVVRRMKGEDSVRN